jgi:hypothetical protein
MAGVESLASKMLISESIERVAFRVPKSLKETI